MAICVHTVYGMYAFKYNEEVKYFGAEPDQKRSYEGKKMYLLYVKFRGNSFENLQKLTFYLVTIKIMTITENKVMSIFP